MSRDKKQNRYKEKSCSRLYAVLHFLLHRLLKFIFRIHVIGAENEQKRGGGAYLLVSNHLTMLDPIWLCAALDNQQPHFMAKAELFKIPLLSQLIRALGAYPVKRGGADVSAIKHTISMLQEGRTVGMFPQGHRCKKIDPRKTEVKSGAAMIAVKAGVPILPVYIKTANNSPRIFRRIDIIIGQQILPDELSYNADAPGEYMRISEYVFDKVCELGD